MSSLLKSALMLLLLFTLLTGVVYPLVVTGLGQLIFAEQANGSLIRSGDRVLGSALIGQPFQDPKHFWPRPSATATVAYNAAASTGSNLGPTNPALAEAIAARTIAAKAANVPGDAVVPADLMTASGSGLDPHISPAAALYQVERVARARGLPAERVRALVESHTEERTFGVLGEPRVNVLLLNLDLDRAETTAVDRTR